MSVAGCARAPLLGHPLRGQPSAGGYEGVGLGERVARTAKQAPRDGPGGPVVNGSLAGGCIAPSTQQTHIRKYMRYVQMSALCRILA